MFRHEKTFYNPPGIFVRLCDDLPIDELKARTKEIASYAVDYVGMSLAVDGFTHTPSEFGKKNWKCQNNCHLAKRTMDCYFPLHGPFAVSHMHEVV